MKQIATAKKYTLLIFDWDGTLMDSRGYIVENMQAAAPERGAKLPDAKLVHAAISAGVEFFEHIRRASPTAPQKINPELTKKYEDYYFSQFAKSGPRLFPSVFLTLQTLKAEGYTLAIATSMSRKSLDIAMQRFQVAEFFSATRSSEETAPKPDPIMLHSLLQEFDVPPERALMIGDTDRDLQMARAAGIDCVAVTTGIHSLERLQSYQPLACLDDIQKLIGLL